jgi:hypothetical protein
MAGSAIGGDPLNRSAAASNDLRDLEDIVTGNKLMTDGILDLSVHRRTTDLPTLLSSSATSCHDPRSDRRLFRLGKYRGRQHELLPPAWTQR